MILAMIFSHIAVLSWSTSPRGRLEMSAALDDTAAYFFDAYGSIHRRHHIKWVNLKLYNRALCSLQHAILDHSKAYSSELLCATAIMQRPEIGFSAPNFYVRCTCWFKSLVRIWRPWNRHQWRRYDRVNGETWSTRTRGYFGVLADSR